MENRIGVQVGGAKITTAQPWFNHTTHAQVHVKVTLTTYSVATSTRALYVASVCITFTSDETELDTSATISIQPSDLLWEHACIERPYSQQR